MPKGTVSQPKDYKLIVEKDVQIQLRDGSILYGNEPNMADGSPGGPAEQEAGSQAGNVLPTQSPGPFVNNSADPDNPTRGRSAGEWMQEGVNIPELCRAAFQ